MNPDTTQQAASSAVPGAATPAEAPFDPGSIFSALLDPHTVLAALRIVAIVAVGLVLVRLLVFLLKAFTRKRLSARTMTILVKTVSYAGFAVVAVNAFAMAGVDLTALLGAAGIAGIAIGFAAQTSIANVISGIFMLSEKSFSVGDVIELGDVSGVVESIDMLSVKVQTFDNRLVRIPNENLIKSNLVNVTRYPIRRLNMDITITHDSDVQEARRTLFGIAEDNPFVLRSPEPIFIVSGFSERGVALFFGVWYRQDRFIEVKNRMFIDVKREFEERGIRLAAQSLDLRTGPHIMEGGTRAKPGTAAKETDDPAAAPEEASGNEGPGPSLAAPRRKRSR